MKIKMKADLKNKKICDAFDEFILNCRVRNLSKHTLTYYEEGYKSFINFYDEKNLISSINKSTINDYIIHLSSNSNMNTTSLNTRLRSLRGFLYYCMKLEYIPSFTIEILKCEKKIKETYTDAELKLLLEKPNLKKCSFTTYRNWVLINYLISTGNRLSSIINIKIEDLDFENATIALKVTKNRKQQIIPMSKTLTKILLEYLQYRKGEPSDYLFCSQTGTKFTKTGFEHTIRQYNFSRGITKTSVHLFRHTFAKKWILSGGDIFRLQKLLGHSSIDIVKEYVNMFSDDLKKDFDTFNPLEQLSDKRTKLTLKK
ncbi:tyrosine-type recombinase/integrase [Clostridium sp. 19966]|uniref:tyrosine-type recombinase/integrase n=1 Tax=Clostridium sp. 19966 TaxID=2768166 RepID=UPI0028DED866|nr:tyrosine-type recombinase/integrase [Clostridium sp. 19966]MDT8718535.1 tyrosine-type recombinase/integrase [Clostridium sp. 19966]